jgi:hypothetical protein
MLCDWMVVNKGLEMMSRKVGMVSDWVVVMMKVLEMA